LTEISAVPAYNPTIGGGRYMEGPLVGVPVAYLLAYKLAHQLDPLRGAQLARQGISISR
jgi:hypothetical protein